MIWRKNCLENWKVCKTMDYVVVDLFFVQSNIVPFDSQHIEYKTFPQLKPGPFF